MTCWCTLLLALVACIPLACASNVGEAYFLTDAAKAGAVCLDGTPGAYYWAPGEGDGSNKWYIHHEGGGWCSSLADCHARSLTPLGSSSSYAKSIVFGGGYFSSDMAQNPLMYNWNKVFLKYCDGGSFSGNNATVNEYQGHKLYFRGFRILTAMRLDLLTNRGLSRATDVVISGCSAGGLATFLHVDWWREGLSQAKVVGMPDSGFFLDYESPGKKYHSKMVWVSHWMNVDGGVNQRCIAFYKPKGETWRCFFAQWTSPFIETPIFPLQSEYDSWQVPNILDSNNPQLVNKYGENLTALVHTQLFGNAEQVARNGIMLDSCYHHCGLWDSIRIDGQTQATAFERFYNKVGTQKIYFQDRTYPCAPCCS